MYKVVLLLASARSEIYNTRVRRSIWISTPSGIQYHSRIVPSHAAHPQVFMPYQRGLADDADPAYVAPIGYRPGTSIERQDYKTSEPVKKKTSFARFKSGVYDAIFGGGVARIFVYAVVAGLFAIVGYQIRKQEEYGSYVRLPAEES